MGRVTTGSFATALLTGALLVTACTSATVTTDATGDRTYVLAGASGSVLATGTPGVVDVAIDDVDGSVDWYAVRPSRVTGEEPVAQLAAGAWAQSLSTARPWVLVHVPGAPQAHGIYGRAVRLVHDAAARRVVLRLEVARTTLDVAGGPSFASPVVTVHPNVSLPAEGSAFTVPGTSARVEPDGAGGHRLILSRVGGRAFALNGAPGPVGDFEDLADFVDRWDDRFGYQMPEATLAGDVGAGNHELIPLRLAAPVHDAAAGTLTFAAIPVADAGAPTLTSPMTAAVLHVDAGERFKASTVFDQQWRGFAYQAVRSGLTSVPAVKASESWDSDITSDNFTSQWGSRDGCGRQDLEVLSTNGANIVRLYDYNYARDGHGPVAGKAGAGHIAFLDEAQLKGIKVIIPISNWNFSNDRYAWDSIDNTVAQIVASVKKDGVIHPAVHSFSVGNELDLSQYGIAPGVLLSRAVQAVGLLNRWAPDHYVTIPISNAREQAIYAMFKSGGTLDGQAVGPIPAAIYASRFYNSVQTFKLGGDPQAQNNDLRTNILEAYDGAGMGVPLLITELGRSLFDANHSVADRVDQVLGQAWTARAYLDAHPTSLFKGFAMFEWQDSNWKRAGGPANSESTFGIRSYDGVLCTGTTGNYIIESGGIAPSTTYPVDRLKEIVTTAHPEGLLPALKRHLQK